MISFVCTAQKKPVLLTEIPFIKFTGGIIAIEARLDTNSRPLLFILDTGCGGISLDSTTCESFHLIPRLSDTTVTGIAGKKRVSYLFNKKLHLPGLTVDSLNIYINDYSDLSSIYGEKIDGVIGYAFFHRYIVSVDFDTARLKIFSPGKMNYGKGTLLKPAFNYLMMQELTVRDHRKVSFPFYMDSGAGICLLLSNRFATDSNIISPKRHPVTTQAEGLGGKKRMQLTVTKVLRLGPYRFKNVPTYIYDDDNNITAYPFTGGLLGNDIMRRFNITFNYGQREVHIVPNKHFTDDFDYAFTGLFLYDVNDGIFIEDIIDNSPAAKAGLLRGDEILGINNNFSGKVVLYNNLLQKAKEKISILIRRDKLLQNVTIEPISILR